jgi:hypothetical protein
MISPERLTYIRHFAQTGPASIQLDMIQDCLEVIDAMASRPAHGVETTDYIAQLKRDRDVSDNALGDALEVIGQIRLLTEPAQ